MVLGARLSGPCLWLWPLALVVSDSAFILPGDAHLYQAARAAFSLLYFVGQPFGIFARRGRSGFRAGRYGHAVTFPFRGTLGLVEDGHALRDFLAPHKVVFMAGAALQAVACRCGQDD
jgi:hypothetical protein